MYQLIRIFALITAVLFSVASTAEETILIPYNNLIIPVKKSQPQQPETIILHWGQDSPDTQYMLKNVEQMAQLSAFSGTVVRVQDLSQAAFEICESDSKFDMPVIPGPITGGSVFGGPCVPLDYSTSAFQEAAPSEARDYEVIGNSLRDLGKVGGILPRLERFKRHFILSSMRIRNRSMNWYDNDHWDKILTRATNLARIARHAGFRGIFIDPERYGSAITNWIDSTPALCNTLNKEDPNLCDSSAGNLYTNKTYQEVHKKVRERGREYIRAINRAFPGCIIWLAYGYSFIEFPDQSECPNNNCRGYLPKTEGLLGAFIDGMLEASDAETIFIDGIEGNYTPCRWDGKCEEVHYIDKIMTRALDYTTVPRQYKEKMRIGFGIRMDYTLNSLEHDINKAFCLSDQLQEWNHGSRYIWIWHQAHRCDPNHPDSPCPDNVWSTWCASEPECSLQDTWWLPSHGRTRHFPTDVLQSNFSNRSVVYKSVPQSTRDTLATLNDHDRIVDCSPHQ